MFHVEQLFRICRFINMIPRAGLSCVVRAFSIPL